MPAKARGQWGMGSDAYGRHTSKPIVIGSKSTGRLMIMAEQRLQCKTSTNRIWNSSKHSLNRNYRPGRILEDGRVASVTTISGLAVHSHGAYGKEWKELSFDVSGYQHCGSFCSGKPFPASDKYVHLSIRCDLEKAGIP